MGDTVIGDLRSESEVTAGIDMKVTNSERAADDLQPVLASPHIDSGLFLIFQLKAARNFGSK